MCAETINESIPICQYVGMERKVRTVEGEVVLPDIKPDILSIVKMKGRVGVQQVKAEEGKVTVEGTLMLHVVYIADDDTNSQRGISEEISFTETIPFAGVTPESIVRLKYETGNLEYKVNNNRKITLKVPIVFYVKAYQNCQISIVKGITDDDAIEVQKETQKVCDHFITGNTTVELKENVQLNDSNLPIGEIIDCELQITHKEYKISYHKILAKADANVSIVYVADNENQTIDHFTTTLPLMGIIDLEGMEENDAVQLDYLLQNFNVRPVYQDMQANGIAVEIVADINAYVCHDYEMELVTDLYTPNRILQCETEENRVLTKMMCAEESFTISQTLVVPEWGNTQIISMTGEANVQERNVLNGKLAITGNIEIEVLYIRAANHFIESKKLELPFQQVIKMEGITPNSDPQIHVEVEEIQYQLAGENQLQVTIPLQVTCCSEEEQTMNSIHQITISPEEAPIMPSMVIYYVKPGDSLWKIAKKYRNKVEWIKEFNELKEDTIYPGQRLLIPKLVMPSVPTSVM